MREIRVSIHSFPPYSTQSPMPALGYLKGYLNKHLPEAAIKNYFWSQTLINKCLAKEVKLIPEFYNSRNSLFRSIFAYLYLQASSEQSSEKLNYIEKFGAMILSNKSLTAYRLIAQKVKTFIEEEVRKNNCIEDNIIGASILFNQEISSLYFLRYMKNLNPEAVTVLGGMTKNDVNIFLKCFPFVDICIYGEGERAFAAICEQYANGNSLDSINGIAYRKNDEIIINDYAAPIEEIDPIWANYDDFDWNDSIQSNKIIIPVWDARGCWWGKCKFCNLNKISSLYRERSAESILDEIKYHIGRFRGIESRGIVIQFLANDSYGKSQDRFLHILKELCELKKTYRNLSVFMELSPNHMNEELALYLNELGATIQFGFEQWSNSVKLMNKSHQVEQGIFTLKLVEKYPMIKITGTNLLVGFPGETILDVYEAYNTLYKQKYILKNLLDTNRIQDFHTNNFVMFPNTPLSDLLRCHSELLSEYQRKNPMTQILTMLCGNEDLAVEYMNNTEGIVLPDVTQTSNLGKAAHNDLLNSLNGIRIESFVSPDKTLNIITVDEAGKKIIKFKGLMVDVLKLTKGITTYSNIEEALDHYSKDDLQKALAILVDKGFIYNRAKIYINTLPASLQLQVDLL